MPPASLSTFAVMTPGPRTAKKMARFRMKPRVAGGFIFLRCSRNTILEPASLSPCLADHAGKEIVDRDDPLQHLVVVDDGDGKKIILVHREPHFLDRILDM